MKPILFGRDFPTEEGRKSYLKISFEVKEDFI